MPRRWAAVALRDHIVKVFSGLHLIYMLTLRVILEQFESVGIPPTMLLLFSPTVDELGKPSV